MAPGDAGRRRARAALDRHAAEQGERLQHQGQHLGRGERIYHLPSSRDYERTRINDRACERIFCSGEEAKAAGWRAARG